VLRQTAKTAIGRFVMREKEHVCAIEAYRQALPLTTLNYDYEIRDIARVDGLTEEPTISQSLRRFPQVGKRSKGGKAYPSFLLVGAAVT